MNLMLMQKITSERIVVQPYTFSTANMTTVWNTPRPIPGAFNRFGKQMWCQRFRILIPGYVFEVSAKNMYNAFDKTNLAIYENGVIVPPCKVGDTVYSNERIMFEPVIVKVITTHQSMNLPISYTVLATAKDGYGIYLSSENFNEDWFLTKAEAEQKLKEVQNER